MIGGVDQYQQQLIGHHGAKQDEERPLDKPRLLDGKGQPNISASTTALARSDAAPAILELFSLFVLDGYSFLTRVDVPPGV